VIVGWIYFIFAWLSLFVINGIVSFMLTPVGGWRLRIFGMAFSIHPLALPSFSGPSLPSVLQGSMGSSLPPGFRKTGETANDPLLCALACSALCPACAVGLVVFAGVPPEARAVISDPTLTVHSAGKAFLVLTPIVFLAGLFMAVSAAQVAATGFSFVLMILAFLYLGPLKW